MGKDDEEISYATNKKNLQKSKIVFVGDQYVGKTSVISRFITDSFESERNPTIGIDFVSKNITLGSKMMRMQLWDTAGQERFRSLIPSYIKDCHVALIVFDLTNEESFDNLAKWVDFVKENRGDDAMIVTVGNKLDLKEERKVAKDAILEKFDGMNLKYFEVSAKTGENIEKMFQEICAELLNIDSESNLPPLEIQKSKLVSNIALEREEPIKKEQKTEKTLKKMQTSTKLSRTVSEERRVKQKECC